MSKATTVPLITAPIVDIKASNSIITVRKGGSEILSLGRNPVDDYYAYKAAIESSIDIVTAMFEIFTNGTDRGTTVIIRLDGMINEKDPNMIMLTRVIVEDDGCGMDHATVFERFRGAFFNSDSHARTDMSGRNGVGVKTNLQYWKKITVLTTTRGRIPTKEQWECSDQYRDKIEETYRAVTTLKPGDPDTELRSYTISLDETVVNLPWGSAPADQSGTTVILSDPRQNIVINQKILLSRLSHLVEFLDPIRHPHNSLKLVLPNDKEIDVHQFMKDRHRPYVAAVHGNAKEDLVVNWETENGTKQSKVVPACRDLDDIEIDIRMLAPGESGSQDPNEFVLSVCGANLYEASDRRRGSILPVVEFLLRQDNFKMPYGFGYRLHGFIKSNDERLKRALRHNKSGLDMEDKNAQAFMRYTTSVLKPLNEIYEASLSDESSVVDRTIQDLIAADVQKVLTKQAERVKIVRGEDNGGKSGEVKSKEYLCRACMMVWRVPLDKSPSYCCEFDRTGREGCGSRDIERNTHDKSDPGETGLRIEYVDVLGGFIPARYEPNENKVYIASYHPMFVTELNGVKKEVHLHAVGVEQALFAIAIHRADNDERSLQDIYGELLRCWYETRTDAKKLKSICRKLWKENGISFEAI